MVMSWIKKAYIGSDLYTRQWHLTLPCHMALHMSCVIPRDLTCGQP